MDFSLTPDTYAPVVDEHGTYIDKVPIIKNGIYCLCGSRKDKMYDSTAKFSAHIKTLHHQHWLVCLNRDKANHFVDSIKYKELSESQKKIMIHLENQLATKTTQLTEKMVVIETLKSHIQKLNAAFASSISDLN
jgi:hypothetical protein